MNYWTAVFMNEEQLAELVEGDHDLPYALWEKLNQHLEAIREKVAEMQAAQDGVAIPQVDWDHELTRFLDT